jgi:hypothetical protein
VAICVCETVYSFIYFISSVSVPNCGGLFFALLIHNFHSMFFLLRFRIMLDLPSSVSDIDACTHLLNQFVFVHLEDDEAKFELGLLILRKLYAFVGGDSIADNPDALNTQELLLSGHLYLMILKVCK